jgi:hypothetical protein
MSPEGLVIALALLIIVGLCIGAPLLRRESPRLSDDALAQKQRDRLLAYYERVLTNIRDLEEDHATGKLQTTEYEVEREAWVQRGIQILKALDNIQAIPAAADEAAVEETIDDEIEAAIAAYRSKRPASQAK